MLAPSRLSRAACAAGLALLMALPALAHEGAAGDVDAGHSAFWYAPERDGEGWVLEISDAGFASLYWFTYDDAGEPRWLVGLGSIEGSEVVFAELMVTRGGRFGPDFDPEEVERETVGSGHFHFDGCDSGSFSYAAFGFEETIPVQRLNRIPGVGCAAREGDPEDLPTWQSGSWFDPSHAGEGFILQWGEAGVALMAWFSYTPDGEQFWMVGPGVLDDGELVFAGIAASRGTRFGPDFDPAEVERYPFGELRLVLDCEQGVASYSPVVEGFAAGEQVLARLTRAAGPSCASGGPSRLDQAEWVLASNDGPRLSELPAAVLGDAIIVAGGLVSLQESVREAWRYLPRSNSWSRIGDLPANRDHAMMAAAGDAAYLIGGYAVALQGQTNTVYRLAAGGSSWSTAASMPRVNAAGGAATLDGKIYVGGGRAGPVMQIFDPAANSWTLREIEDPHERDHSALVAFEGEIWILGGRSNASGATHGQVTIYDPDTGATRPGPPMNDPRSGFAATVVDGEIVVAGGEAFPPVRVVGSTEAYSPESGEWRRIDPMLTGIHGHGLVTFDGDVIATPGSSLAGGIGNTGRTQRLEVSEDR